MGATMMKLANQGHAVHVAYQTSGNYAVFDSDAIRMLDFHHEMTNLFFNSNAENTS